MVVTLFFIVKPLKIVIKNMKFTPLTFFKCVVQSVTYIRIVVWQVSRTFASCRTEALPIEQLPIPRPHTPWFFKKKVVDTEEHLRMCKVWRCLSLFT